jgi:heterodisulfide reductase subunit B
MASKQLTQVSYFPGCSLATTARESNRSLVECCRRLGIDLIELEDWNCCGSSSAHSINSHAALWLAARNIALAPPGRPLIAACPGCLLQLRRAYLHLKEDREAQEEFARKWGRPFDGELEILHFFELLDAEQVGSLLKSGPNGLLRLRFAPYYGCMLNRPPALRHEKNYHGLMEKTLSAIGAQPLRWAYGSRCCGTFLTVARPDIVSPMVNRIVQGAMDAGAECIITACAMCYMNLEVRCTLRQAIPILHFSEVLSLALGTTNHKNWFSRHLIDPRPLLKSKGF